MARLRGSRPLVVSVLRSPAFVSLFPRPAATTHPDPERVHERSAPGQGTIHPTNRQEQ
jgi:hypothetical protein